MAAAGFTHGDFHKHFLSKADLMAESAACGIAQTAALAPSRVACLLKSHETHNVVDQGSWWCIGENTECLRQGHTLSL